jgi:formylglycine-generating enzyme required for sulfatase activity
MGTDASELDRLRQVFGMKSNRVFIPEIPRHTVRVDAFYMDKREVTNAQFKAFIDAHPQWQPDRIPARYHNGDYLKHWEGDRYPPGKGEYPVVYVSWYAAVAYAQWAGKRLPTEAEWEYAARGGLVRKQYPWGDDAADTSRANYAASGIGEATAAGSYPPNGYGLCDMAGNVWEYCVDEWQEGYNSSSPKTNPVSGDSLFLDDAYLSVSTRRVIRGGSWGGSPVNLRVAYRDSHPPEGAGPHVGFRCARPAERPGKPD